MVAVAVQAAPAVVAAATSPYSLLVMKIDSCGLGSGDGSELGVGIGLGNGMGVGLGLARAVGL